ncbi:MAG TPA: ATP-binding protein [Gemmatimonadaceae bacterium]|nr:ATP-binding protein [Gemmatimonadaceae bacterium]
MQEEVLAITAARETRSLATDARLTSETWRSEAQFHQLLEKLPAGAYTCDPDGLITYFNQHAVALWGRAPQLNDPVDRWCGSFKLFAPNGAPISHDRCWMALALEQDREFNGHEIVVERPNGERITALAHANPIRDAAGTLVGAVNVLIDISDQKRSEEILRQADSAKNEFLATLAHELRNPLAPIRNAIEVMNLKGELTPDLRRALDIIDRQVKQMSRLVDDLIDVARITGNKFELKKERLDLATVVSAAVETSRPVIDTYGHVLTVAMPGEPVALEGDLTRLAQAVANLLNNAAKYTPHGGTISVRAEGQGSEAVIFVRDTGVGISPDMLPRVFDMFTQATASPHAQRDGLGIGLTLVRRLVELHGGTVAALSAGLGQGSEFVIRLPVAESASPLNGSRATRSKYPVLDLRILVADDNPDSATSLGMLLRILGSDVRIAHDGDEALRTAAEFQPHVMLLDIGMPKANGYEVAKRVRTSDWGRPIVLIAVTGWGQKTDRERSREAGFDHHLVKPVDASELIAMLASLKETTVAPNAVA